MSATQSDLMQSVVATEAALEVLPKGQNIVEGDPTASILTPAFLSHGLNQCGIWEITGPCKLYPARQVGKSEFFHIVAGRGKLVGDDGTEIALEPGVTVILRDGWVGSWVVEETIRKVYAQIESPSDGAEG